MSPFTIVYARALSATAVLTLLALAVPAPAGAQSTVTPSASGAPSATPSATTAAPRAKRAKLSGVEQRIVDLHKRLQIQPNQEDKWAQVAQVMRDNATALAAVTKDRVQHAKTMTAVENLVSFEKISQAHQDGMKKLIPVFQSLYDSMSDAQRKNADSVFRGPPRRKARAG